VVVIHVDVSLHALVANARLANAENENGKI